VHGHDVRAADFAEIVRETDDLSEVS
jgi:hypothetical protein